MQPMTEPRGYTMTPGKTAEYLQTLEDIRGMLQRGEIRAYCTGFNHEVGRYLQVETEQGWDPSPVWQEFSQHHYRGANDGQDLNI